MALVVGQGPASGLAGEGKGAEGDGRTGRLVLRIILKYFNPGMKKQAADTKPKIVWATFGNRAMMKLVANRQAA